MSTERTQLVHAAARDAYEMLIRRLDSDPNMVSMAVMLIVANEHASEPQATHYTATWVTKLSS